MLQTVPRRRRPEGTSADLVDLTALRAELAELAKKHGTREQALRAAVAARLKAAFLEGREAAEKLLLADGSGRACAERLSRLMDGVVGLAFEVATGVYRSDNPSSGERMAVVAVGGYGRGMLAPGSDIDLLFLLPYKQTAWGESVAESVLYALWDMGLKVGHATRSVDECIRQARADMTIRTALLEARFLFGDRALFDEFARRFDGEVVQGTAAEFVAAKLAERAERHRRAGQSRYLVEPNVKDGKGGQRDMHTLFWIAKYVYRVHTTHELAEKGVFSRAELGLFRRCEEFLWAVRCHLHFLAGRAEERLSFEVQRDMAVRLGYTEHAGLKDVERFMKHYFLVAKDVGDLTGIVCAELEEQLVKPSQGLTRMVARLVRRTRRPMRDYPDFVVEYDRINVADAEAFARDPVNLIRMFHLAERHDLDFRPDALRLARRSLNLIDAELRADATANQLFREILTSRKAPEPALRKMNEIGVLGRFVPEFGRVVAMMQFNLYHHYTVDEHLIRCIGVLSEIERGKNPEYGLANELMAGINHNRDLLYVALFLHDIAKGRPEDHSIAGAKIARKFCPRLGFSAAETETVAWLVDKHLVMSTIAQSRDLNDRKTVEDFAAVVQNLDRMKLLLILTTADIRAVGPGVWNGWKAQLLRNLYYETEPTLTGGFSEVNRTRRIELAQAEFKAALTGWDQAAVERYVARHYPPYWLKVDLAHKLAHAEFLREAEQHGRRLATAAKIDPERGVTELTILAPDHPRLLSMIAGACAAAGGNIVDAQIFTTTDGLALDSISISREFERDEDEERRTRRIAEGIEQALKGEARFPEVMARKAKPRYGAFTIEPEVNINNVWSNRHTVIEVAGLDRPGLLHDLTHAISRLNLNIASAHIATFGERVVDVFYVTDLVGAKITTAPRQAAIRRALLAVFEREGEAAARRAQ